MDDKTLRKLTRKELLEILLLQTKRIEEIELELMETKKELESKKIIISESGSIAEASLKLNGIFETAQIAIDQYVDNVKENCRKLEEKTKKECQKKEEESEKYLNELEEKIKQLTKNNLKILNESKKTKRKTTTKVEKIVIDLSKETQKENISVKNPRRRKFN